MFENLQGHVVGLSVEPPLPVAHTADISKDVNTPPVADSGRDLSSGASLFIQYRDASGNESARRIACKKITGDGVPEIIQAFCFERRALRAFRVDRIVEMICCETGEIFNPVEHLTTIWRSGPIAVEDTTLTRLSQMLVFMARCDGVHHPLETAAIDDVLCRYALRFDLDDRHLDSARNNIQKNQAPDGSDFITSLRHVARHEQASRLSRLVLDGLGSVSDADGVQAEREFYWGVEASNILKRIATS